MRIKLLVFSISMFLPSFLTAQEKTIFEENFDNNYNKWIETEDSIKLLKIVDGRYLFDHKSVRSTVSFIKIPVDTKRDFSVSCNTIWINGIANNLYGLNFGASDVNNGYYFCISANGYYCYLKTISGNWEFLIKWTESGYINKKGNNNISIRKNGSIIEFYINDQKVNQYNFDAFFGDKFGFRVSDKQKILFDDLKIRYIGKQENSGNILSGTLNPKQQAGTVQKIENLRFEQAGKQIIIYYDLNGTRPWQTYDIQVFCSTDGGKTLGAPLKKVTGDAGKSIRGGTGKKIIWDVLSEREKLAGDIIFEVQIRKININNDLSGRNIEGKIKSVFEAEYVAVLKKKEIQKSSLLSKYTTKYDETLNLLETNRFKADGSPDLKYTYKYDENGTRTGLERYKSDGSLEYKFLYKYNEKGTITESDRYKPDGNLEYKNIFLNDEKGNRIEWNNSKSDGSLEYRYTYKYDENQDLIEINYTNKDTSLSYKSVYKLDEKGNRIEWNNFKPDGSLKYKYTYKYNDDGETVEMNRYKSDNSLDYRETYIFDEKGKRIQLNRYKSDQSLEYIETYKFDKYDITGNWTIQTVFRNDSPTKIIERIIDYY